MTRFRIAHGVFLVVLLSTSSLLGQRVIWSERDIRAINTTPPDSDQTVIVPAILDVPHSLALDNTRGFAFIAQNGPDGGSIARVNADGSHPQIIVPRLMEFSRSGIAVNEAAGTILWSEFHDPSGGVDGSRIMRADLDGANQELLWETPSQKIHKINYDEANDFLYYIDQVANLTFDLHRARLDGSDNLLIDTASALAFTTDVSRDRIFYFRNSAIPGELELIRASLDGTNKAPIHSVPADPIPFAIDIEPTSGDVLWTSGRNSGGPGIATVYRIDADGTNAGIVFQRPEDLAFAPTDLQLDPLNGHLYCVTNYVNAGLFRSSLTGEDFLPLIQRTFGTPDGLAIDRMNQKLYWTDYFDVRILRSDLDGSNLEIINVQDLDRPGAITLDPAAGHMYWLAWDSLQRANLDGSDTMTILTPNPNSRDGLALDLLRGHIYWIDNFGIRRADLDGSNVVNVVADSEIDFRGLALDVAAGKMYWGKAADNSTSNAWELNRANLDGTGVETLISDLLDGVGQITLDFESEKLYWTGRVRSIRRADMDGSNQEIVAETSGSDRPFGIVLQGPTASGGSINVPVTSTPAMLATAILVIGMGVVLTRRRQSNDCVE